MKVSELITLLQTAEPDTEVSITSQDGCCGDQEFHDIIDADFDPCEHFVNSKLVRTKDFPHGLFRIYLTAAHGATTCRKSGMIHSAIREYEEQMAAWRKEQEEKSKT